MSDQCSECGNPMLSHSASEGMCNPCRTQKRFEEMKPVSDLAKLIEEWEKAKKEMDASYTSIPDYGHFYSFDQVHAERLAAQSIIDELQRQLAVAKNAAPEAFKELCNGESNALRARIDALKAALNCEECGGTGIDTRGWSNGDGLPDKPCASCSPTRELVRGGGR